MKKQDEFPFAKPDLHKYKHFICVDGDNRPMSWDGDQLCYNTSSLWQDTQFPIQVYSRRKAWELIQRTIKFRKRKKWDVDDYGVMPVLLRGICIQR